MQSRRGMGRPTLGAVSLALLSVILCTEAPQPGYAQPDPRPKILFGIATATPHQAYHDIGEGLGALMNERLWESLGTRAVAVVTGGSLENVDLLARVKPPPIYRVRDVKDKNGESYWTLKKMPNEKECPLPGGPWTARFRVGLISSVTPAFLSESQQQKLCGLAVLWREYAQLVVTPKSKKVFSELGLHRRAINDWPIRFAHLSSQEKRALRIYVGPPGSILRGVAKVILGPLGLTQENFETPFVRTYEKAAEALIADAPGIDAAFFVGGLPTPAVEKSLAGDCRLLPLDNWKQWKDRAKRSLASGQFLASEGLSQEDPPKLLKALSILNDQDEEDKKIAIPTQTYEGLTRDVPTISSTALLVASAALPPDQARGILSAIFDARDGEAGQEDLVKHHEVAEEIRLLRTLSEVRTPWKHRRLMPFRFHPGAHAFWDREGRKLKIAAGSLEGTSFRLGIEVAAALTDHDIPARVINSDGDEESMTRLKQGKVDLALLHNDVAAVGFAGAPIAENGGRVELPHWVRTVRSYFLPDTPKGDMQLLSFLHPEAVHALAALVPEQHRRECKALREAGEPRDFKQLLGLLIRQNKLPRLALADKESVERSGDMPKDRDTVILRHFARLLDNEDVVDTFIREHRLPQLSIAQAQNRLVTGHIAAVLVTSGVPMEAFHQLLARKEIPRLDRLARQDVRCPYCDKVLEPGQTLRVGLLQLHSAEPSHPSGAKTPDAAAVPYSIQGLVANDRWLDPFVIPPHTYPAVSPRQPAPANTAAVKVVLVCRTQCPSVYDITGSLVDEEVRLRSIVRGIDLHKPLLQEEDEPSIPVHAEARRYYSDQGILQRLPPRSGFLAEAVIPHLQSGLIGLLLGSLGPSVWRKVGNWRAHRKAAFERQLRDAYFQQLRHAYLASGRDGHQLPEELEVVWGRVLEAYGRNLRPEYAEDLDKRARDYREYLRKEAEQLNLIVRATEKGSE